MLRETDRTRCYTGQRGEEQEEARQLPGRWDHGRGRGGVWERGEFSLGEGGTGVLGTSWGHVTGLSLPDSYLRAW